MPWTTVSDVEATRILAKKPEPAKVPWQRDRNPLSTRLAGRFPLLQLDPKPPRAATPHSLALG
jgi:hypothetical protein